MVQITAAAMAALVLLLGLVIGMLGQLAAHTPGGASSPSQTALADIPADYLALYRAAAAHVGTTQGCRLDWTILAAIGKIETNHGRSPLPGVHNGSNAAGARGPMQFLPATFQTVVARHPPPPGGNSPPSPYNPHDAIHTAAAYLCDSGVRDSKIRQAIYAYNHASWYVDKVLAQAEEYRTARRRGGWIIPVHGTCTSGYGPRPGGFHDGQDIAAPIGTPIHAAAAGTVLDAGPATGYGLWVRIQHAGGVITTYGHNHTNYVTSGQQVRAGQVIAEVGNRGQSSGAHLHFEITARGHPLDPVTYYRNVGGPPLC